MAVPTLILVPTDFSDRATAALDYAVDLAAALGARLCLAHVVSVADTPSEYGLSMTAAMIEKACERQHARLDELSAARAGRATFAPGVITTGDPRAEIEHVARQVGADLIVMGTRGRRGLPRLVLGSVAETVLRVAPCPVLLVRAHADAA
ncbi:MAG TPA: universal stress protein [Kofleriaceae bacterium]|nr:universal stress protein [Kofleriaceae bacterium]